MAIERVNLYDQISSNKSKSIALVVVFIVILVFMGGILGEITGFGIWGLVFALMISAGLAWYSYYNSDQVALSQANALPADPKKYQLLYNIVEGVSIAGGIPVPKIYIVNDPSPNAFATGRDPEHASIAVTTGLLGMMDRQELEGVIAHELSHVKNYDIRFSSMVVVLVGAIALIAGFTRMFTFWGGGGREERNDGGLGIALLVIGILFAILAPIIAQLIQLAVSRKRESLADANGALLSRNPQGLASALRKIGNYTGELKNVETNAPPLRTANTSTAHMYFTNPFNNASSWFSTHPPIKERIAALEAMA